MNDVRQREYIYALVDTLEYLHKGGRVSWVKATIGTMLKMKFIISVMDGQVTRVGQVRTRRSGWEKIKDLLIPHAPFDRLGVFHCGADPEEVNEIVEMFVQYLTPSPSSASVNKPFVIPLTPIIGAHTGPNFDWCSCSFRQDKLDSQPINMIKMDWNNSSIFGKIEEMKPSLTKILKIFRHEGELGYEDRAVIGGLGKLVSFWENEARAEEVPEEIVQAVCDRLRDYHRLSTASRREVLQGLVRRIQRYQEEYSSQEEKSDTSLKTPSLESVS
jgi:hypothetical protein